MITRRTLSLVQHALSRQAAVALIGPRQVGKTTLAFEIAEQQDALYLDLEDIHERDKLSHPAAFLSAYEDKLVIMDEIHRAPELFLALRGLIDQGRRRGKRTGRFLLLGSASLDLLRQSGESLAGRISYIDMTPLTVLEVDANEGEKLWIRGGFPDSFLASDDQQSVNHHAKLTREPGKSTLKSCHPGIVQSSGISAGVTLGVINGFYSRNQTPSFCEWRKYQFNCSRS